MLACNLKIHVMRLYKPQLVSGVTVTRLQYLVIAQQALLQTTFKRDHGVSQFSSVSLVKVTEW